MDDIFGTAPKYSSAQQMTLKEMARKANDRIRVYNPTDQDYTVRWDGIGFRVPARTKDEGQGPGQAVFPRYIAQNYVKHMADKILGERMIDAIVAENKRRESGGMATMNQWQDRVQFDTQFRIDNPVARGELVSKVLWVGIEEEYGLDVTEDAAIPQRDNRTLDEQILSNLERPAKRMEQPVNVEEVLAATPEPTPASAPAPTPVATPVEPTTPEPSVPDANPDQVLSEVAA